MGEKNLDVFSESLQKVYALIVMVWRWKQIFVKNSGEYQFWLMSDDGSRLYINDKMVINHWSTHGSTEKSGKIHLPNGVHNIR